ncbi:EAL domain-containing protein [Clostridium sardiniense]|uniref:EAL domain-containing protein n=1 Tax=Clostridium sardiniense TaxID=29369 RepID=UPI00195E7F84|nr:EAL domain-containing protein [Clostridium sardiniense]MBM7835574.1 EAL domain-containing protein (putative c-di-GMP-specific phosphodiesterase class I) [Clostridium sardiniense]
MKKNEIKKLEIFYQPKVDLKSNEFIGAEALARFTDKNNKLINTESVISLAVNYKKMCELTTAVVNKVFIDLKYLESLNRKLINISINISSVEVENDNLISWITKLFNNDNKKYIKYIEFEITERNKVSNLEKFQLGIKFLRSRGFKVSIDDVGSGYNTIDVIHFYDVNYIKLDKSLIDFILENTSIEGLKYLEKTIKLAHSLNMKVIAEGIEDKFTYKALYYLNCDYGQGFYISKPCSINQIIDILAKEVFIVA